ncbi:hypothetical protein BDN70DRAFT_831218 [Pholiota conissans]|uniref:DNA polymerase n=1 Tax=Pholiota conissans TaxID=109636 RepID=A0A9P5Z7H0_9AGAR|nr:hypothetical protein BDN70DRAFT_831218 [Pholiota conissans]
MPEPDVTPSQPEDAPKIGKLQVHIYQIDHVLVPPGQLDNSPLPRVPVLRIFGSSSTGQSACVHVHQVYPYFYVQYTGKLEPRHVKRYIATLFHSLNHAVSLSLKRKPDSPKSQFIRAIVLVKGIDFYGFHVGYAPFLKILAADPTCVSRMVSILRSGTVMGVRFRIFESHLSYILQFLCDFNLYGCGQINIEEALERAPEASQHDADSIPMSDLAQTSFGPSPYFRESRLPLEVDIIAPQILNRRHLSARIIHNRLATSTPELQSDPLVLGVRELWEDERSHRRALGLKPSPEMPLDSSAGSRKSHGEWISEARWWDEIRQRIEREKTSLETAKHVDSDQDDWDSFVMSTFESVEAIWEKKHKTWRPSKRENRTQGDKVRKHLQPPEYFWEAQSGLELDDKDRSIEVDLSLLTDQEIVRLDQEEKQRWDEEALQGQVHGEDEADEEDGGNQGEDLESPEIVAQDIESNSADPFKEDDIQKVLLPEVQDYRLDEPRMPPSFALRNREGSPTPARLSSFSHPDVGSDNIIIPQERMYSMELNLTPIKSTVKTISRHETHLIGSKLSPQAMTPLNGDFAEQLFPPEPGLICKASTVLPVLTPVLSALQRSCLIHSRAIKLSKIYEACKTRSSNSYAYSVQPPPPKELIAELTYVGLPSKLYQAPFYSRDEDIPDSAKEYAGLMYHLKGGQGIATLDDWSTGESKHEGEGQRHWCPSVMLDASGVGGWEYASHPPSIREIRTTLHLLDKQIIPRTHNKGVAKSQIEGPTQHHKYGLKTSPLKGNKSTSRERANMSVLSVEIFVPTQEDKVPNPQLDELTAVFYAYQVSGMDIIESGVCIVQSEQLLPKRLGRHLNIEVFPTELDLLNQVVDLVIQFDPDILIGWEVQNNSWGYIEARGTIHGLEICELISRAPAKSKVFNEEWAFRKSSTLKVAGRHVFNLWRVMRTERTLTIYTFENVVFDVLQRRVPKYSYKTLTEWFQSPAPLHGSYLVQHMSMRAVTNIQLLEGTDTITKTAEFARVFGVDFFSVLTRGSQFKVESFLFRLAKPESFVLISPSKSDVGKQNGAECMPLIMEPASAFYSSPLLVLDFASLYPSIMIAYNYCYSTCLGRVVGFQGKNRFGIVDDLTLSPEILHKLQDHINVAPNGIMYVKSNVRKGLLPRLLIELLDTRVMVKQAMKRSGTEKTRKRILDARQMGLKYIANVIYGYTGASFSGRMPAVEIADSIVQSGRETLEKAIDVIDSNKKWGAKVVYGDTDSVFVYLPGKTKEQAFALGHEIANTITAMNPSPIKLKFEKVYLPCVLMAKKRYVGFKYESVDEGEPTFDAKGIETVRRDSVLAQRKMVENCLKILFRTQDLSEVKKYCCDSWTKLLENKAPVHDFIFAKEVKMGTYSDKGPPPPGVVIAANRLIIDSNDEPKYGERVPYVIVSSSTGARLVDRAMDPLEFMNNGELRLDAVYYITKVLIPPIERIFNLVGADVQQWFNEMPKAIVQETVSPRKSKGPDISPVNLDPISLNGHFSNTQCLSCGEPALEYLCDECCMTGQETLATLACRARAREERFRNAHLLCVSCTSTAFSDPVQCESLDCQWFYARRKAEARLELVPLFEEVSRALEDVIEDLEELEDLDDFENFEEDDSIETEEIEVEE